MTFRIAAAARSHNDFLTAVVFAATMLRYFPTFEFQMVNLSYNYPKNAEFSPHSDFAVFRFCDITVNRLLIDVPEDAT
ncbi:MAG: hypothetical protein OSA51_00690 [Octadecabacter sp.]|nr:hypothetical protein [Octadecabacter sp.]